MSTPAIRRIGIPALALATAIGSAHAQDQATVALVNVTVIPMDTERVLPGHTVVVRDGRIVALGPTDRVAPPSGARVIDGSGRYLIPGLADMHTHFNRREDLDRFLANGVTTVRLMWGWGRALAWRDSIGAGHLAGPTLVVAGPIVEGTPPPGFEDVIATQGRRLVNTREEGLREARRQKAWAVDFIKVYNNLSAEAYGGLVEGAREVGLPVAGHVPFGVGLRGALAAKQRSIEHLRGYIQELVPSDAPDQPGPDLRSRSRAWRHADTTRMDSLAGITRAAGVWNTPTLVWQTFLLPQEEVTQYLEGPEARYLTPGLRANLADRSRIQWFRNFSDEDFRLASEGYERQEALLRALYRAGAGILAGTDIGPIGLSLHTELERLVAAGLPPFAALVAATRGPAEFLGWEDAGTVAPGKRADLVLLTGNPLEEIGNTRRIEAVMVRGQWLDGARLEEMRLR